MPATCLCDSAPGGPQTPASARQVAAVPGARSGDGRASYDDILMTLSNTDVVVRWEPVDPRARAGIEPIGVGKDSLELSRAIGPGSTRFYWQCPLIHARMPG